ncbi:hypothetical protein G6F65_020310 [Rhizopus arrhizus]|nr:hypothetical protein G6F65_020310 [Rhizopus arrhizus]
MWASACKSAARPSWVAMERCLTRAGATSSGRGGRPGKPAGAANSRARSSVAPSVMARTAAIFSGHAAAARAASACPRRQSVPAPTWAEGIVLLSMMIANPKRRSAASNPEKTNGFNTVRWR